MLAFSGVATRRLALASRATLVRPLSTTAHRLDSPTAGTASNSSTAPDDLANLATGSPQTAVTSKAPTGELVTQAPNLPKTWSPSQQPRQAAYDGARFEQTALEYQPRPPSAMEMIAKVPVIMVAGRKAVCDGGGGALGHPKVYINLDQPGPRSCGYCGLRFEQDLHHHGAHAAH